MIYAVIVGAVLFVIGIALKTFANQEGLQIILFFITAFIIGLVAVGIKRGFILSFALSFVFALVNALVTSPGIFNDPNVIAAVVMLFLINSIIGGAIGAAGGFIGGRVFKKN